MQHLFIFSKTRFISELLEKVLSTSEFRPFSTDQTQGLDFYLNDMKPRNIVIDQNDFALNELQQLSSQFKTVDLELSIYMILSKESKLEDREKINELFCHDKMSLKLIERPFSPFDFLALLKIN